MRLCEEGMIESYLQYSEFQESPQDFHIWTCISCIAIALGRSCYVDWGSWKVYPNLFVILVGESATTHKSTAIRMGVKQMEKVLGDGIHGTGQKITPEALIKYMKELATTYGEAATYLCISELSVLLSGQKIDDALIKAMSDLWDCDDRFEAITVSRGQETVDNVCLNMIAGTTPEWLKNSVP